MRSTPFVRSDRMSKLVGGWREQSADVCQAESIVHVAYINAAQVWLLAGETPTKGRRLGGRDPALAEDMPRHCHNSRQGVLQFH